LAVSASHEEIFLLSVYCKRPCTFHRLLFFLFSVNSASPRPLWVNRFLSFLFFLFPSSSFSSLALKLCKQLQRIEESAVSYQRDAIFHTLINTCVENLILQKYFSSSSA